MRDEHRPKRDLLNEVVGLRKQVADLKEAAVVRWRAEEAVRRSEQEYRALVEAAPAGLCRLNATGEFLQVNTAFAEMLGYGTRTEALDLARTREFFTEEGFREQLLSAMDENGAVQGQPAVLLHQNDSQVPVMVSGRRLDAPDGTSDGYILMIVASAGSEASLS